MLRKRPHVRRNRHFVVIQNDNHTRMTVTRVVERLIAHAAGHCAIAHQRQHMVMLPLQIAGARQPQRCGQRGRGMTRLEHIIFAFGALRKAGHAAEGAQGTERAVAPRQQLMDITLMPHIEDDFVLRHVEHAVNRHR